jgi:ribonuclease HI
VVFKGCELVAKVQLKLDNRCSNNQAKQLAILKVLVTIESMNNLSINPRTVTIFTNSRVSLDSLHNHNNHAHLAEEIRKNVTSMVRAKWKIKFSWVKAHAGIYGNEMADRLTKEAAQSNGTNYGYSRIPISAIYRESAEEAIQKWQEEWTKISKAKATKQYFPTVMNRIGTKINLTPKLTAVPSGHGKTRAYLSRFNLWEDAKCTCDKDDQTMDHLLFHCTKTSTQRDLIKLHLKKQKTGRQTNYNS